MLPNRPQIHIEQPNYLKPAFFMLLGLVMAGHVFMALNFEINWDEFFYLDWVYKWRDGKLNIVLQTVYLRLFSWLPSISDNEVDQIISGRLVMLALLALTVILIGSISRRFFSFNASILAVLTFLSFTFVFRHGTSFRADMIVTTLCVFSLWCVTRREFPWLYVLMGAAMFGLAGMITIKAIFYAPVIAAILVVYTLQAYFENKAQLRTVFLKSVCFVVISIVAFLLTYYLHETTIENPMSATDYINDSTKDSLGQTGFFPGRNYFFISIFENWLYWGALAIGLVSLFSKLKHKNNVWQTLTCLAFIFPLFTLLFYYHTFPYYYVFMLAPITVLAAAGYDSSIFKNAPKHYFVPIVIIGIGLCMSVSKGAQQTHNHQKNVVSVVHTLFPEKTQYIDRTAMVSSFPKSGLFMSVRMMRRYYDRNTPIFARILNTKQPKFILANIDSLDLDNITNETRRRFLPEDERVLKENFIHHWGPIYVAGKHIDLGAGQTSQINILIAGNYTLESRLPVTLNNKLYNNGAVIELSQGELLLLSTEDQNITLRWGDKLSVPEDTPLKKRLFNGF